MQQMTGVFLGASLKLVEKLIRDSSTVVFDDFNKTIQTATFVFDADNSFIEGSDEIGQLADWLQGLPISRH